MNLDQSFSKSNQDLCMTCLQNPHYLILSKKTASRLTALLFLISFFIFVAGYFLGKKKLAEDFSHMVERTSFSDQINFALTSLYDKEGGEIKPATPISEDTVQVSEGEAPKNLESLALDEISPSQNEIQEESQKKYAALLFGGNLKSVTQFAQRLETHGITVAVKKRLSKTAKGKKIYWHQAVTQVYDTKLELETLIAKIQQLEKINDIKIVQIPTTV